MVIYKYKRIPEKISDTIPKGWGIGCSDNGWMSSDTFYCYIGNVFYPWAKDTAKLQFPILLFVDGHVSHLTYQLSVFCKSVGIILVALYPNANHLLQPMDVAVFYTLKLCWKEEVQKWRIQNQKEVLKKINFAPLIKNVLETKITPQILQNGFKKTGLFPWNPSAVDQMFQKKINTIQDSTDHLKKQKDSHHALKIIETTTLEAFKQVPLSDE